MHVRGRGWVGEERADPKVLLLIGARYKSM